MGSTVTEVRPQRLARISPADLGPVFVSHSRWDRAQALRLVTGLRGAGVPVWISGTERHCPTWPDTIFPNIACCSAFVVLMTPRSEAAEGVAREVRYAEALGKPIVPVSLDGWRFLGRLGGAAGHVLSNSGRITSSGREQMTLPRLCRQMQDLTEV